MNLDPIRLDQERRAPFQLSQPIPVTSLTTTAATIFTASDARDFKIQGLIAVNVSGSDATVTVNMVPSGGTASTANRVFSTVTVAANTFVTLFDMERQGLLEPNASLVALCSVDNAINIYGHGFEFEGEPGV